jgi:uncharacterized membrane protein YeiB
VFDWLFEGRSSVYFILALAGLLFLILWWRTRKTLPLAALILLVLLVGLYALLDVVVETDREHVTRKVHALTDGVRTRQFDQLFEHVSERFQFGGKGKREWRASVEQVIRNFDVRDPQVWNVEVISLDHVGRRARVSFFAKARTNAAAGPEHFRVELDFVLDPDGQWRMQGAQFFNPFVDSNQPVQIPF